MGKRAMTSPMTKRRYRSTESKYKGGAHEMYVTYDLHQNTRGAQSALYHKVRRVYIAGDVTNWRTGQVRKRTGREVNGLRIEYEQTRQGYRRRRYAAQRARQISGRTRDGCCDCSAVCPGG